MRLLLIFLLFLLQGSAITVNPAPGVTVKVNRLKTDTSKTLSITVNKSDTVTVVPPMSMHSGIPVAPTGWPKPSIVPAFDARLTSGNPIPPLVAPGDEGAFRTVCAFAKMSNDDPIVHPGEPGGAHHHTFYGNTGIDAFTTAANIRDPKNGSTCRGGTVNLTGYWHASLIDTATSLPLEPLSLIAYYKSGWAPVMDPRQSAIEALPQGLRMVIGNPAGTGPDPTSQSSFSCFANPLGDGFNRISQQTIPACLPGEWLRWRLDSKQCWNGQLDSADHRSHLTDPVRVSGLDKLYDPLHPMICPATRPHLLPVISYIAQWNLPAGVDYAKLRLSSDTYTGPAGYSAHADWFNGWDKAVSDVWSKNCHQSRRECGSFTLGDGRNGVEWSGN